MLIYDQAFFEEDLVPYNMEVVSGLCIFNSLHVWYLFCRPIGLDKQKIQRKIMNIL